MNKITIIIAERKILKNDNDNLHLLINVDETPVYFDASFESTIDKKGIKQINIILKIIIIIILKVLLLLLFSSLFIGLLTL